MQIIYKTIQGDISPLVEGVDYYFTHYFLGATRSCGKAIYGSITFLNTSLRGTATLQYQTLGGEWTVNSTQIAEILADQINNPRTTTWEQVSGKPDIFPVIDHVWDLIDMVGMSDVKDSIDRLIDAILTAASSDMTAHINDVISNPHHVTAAQIGAVTQIQLNAAVLAAIQQNANSTDGLAEGVNNKFFTQARVLSTILTGFVPGTNAVLSDQDTLFIAFQKLQAQLAAANVLIVARATSDRPAFTGLGSQNLIKLIKTATALSIDISQAEAFQVSITGSGAIGFNTANVGNMTNKVVEFAITTVNDATANAYAISWPSNVKWVDGTPPPRTTAANAKDYWYFTSEDNMVTWAGSLSNANPS